MRHDSTLELGHPGVAVMVDGSASDRPVVRWNRVHGLESVADLIAADVVERVLEVSCLADGDYEYAIDLVVDNWQDLVDRAVTRGLQQAINDLAVRDECDAQS